MEIENGNIIDVDIEKEMRNAYLEYSMSVIVGRALPDVRDGLKPVHRRILYTMFENGLYPDKGFRKSADTVGSVLGKYHPHGDMSVYDAMVRLAQDFSLRHPLVHGQGNFGSIDGDPAAAYRYTEAKMSKISMLMLKDIEKETVKFVPNYDDKHKEPSVLPSRFPNLLVNGSAGIAVGMATNIPPHNLKEVIGGINCLIKNPDATLDELMEHIKGPDFPTGAMIMGRSGIRSAYATGKGKIIVRAKADIEEMPGGRERIVVSEIPYMLNKSRMVMNIAELVKDKKIPEISGIRDESNRHGIRVVIELKRDANAQVVLNRLYSYSTMQQTFGVIMLALVDGQPKVLTLKEMLEEYIKFQEEIITKRTQFDLNKAMAREHILEGLKKATDIVDEIIATIRGCKGGKNEAKQAIMDAYGFDDIQATAIVNYQLGQLAGLEILKIETELAELQAKIEEYNYILSHEERIKEIIMEELQEVSDKYGDERRTSIETVSGEVDIEDLIPVENCVITLTHFGYIKRQTTDTYRTQRRGGRGISGMTRREEDFAETMFVSTSHDYLMFFTNFGKVYRIKAYEIPESSRTSKGTNIVNILELDQGEKISSVIRVPYDEENEDKNLVMVTKKGIIKRTALTEYKNVRKSGLIAINLDEDDELSWVRLSSGSDKLIVATKSGMCIAFDESDARLIGRTARGVKAITLEDGDEVAGMSIAEEGATLLTVSETGLGRRTEFDEYRTQSRGGKGTRNYYTEKNGLVAGIRSVRDDEDVILITDDGIIIRIPAEQISIQSRYAGGVKVMNLNEDSKVVTMAIAPKEDSYEEDGENDEENEEAISDSSSQELEANEE